MTLKDNGVSIPNKIMTLVGTIGKTKLSSTSLIVTVTQSCLALCGPMDLDSSPWNSPGQDAGVGSLSLLQGIFPTQGSNPGLPHCRRIIYQLSYKGRPRILEWPFPSPADLPNPGIKLGFLELQADFLPTEIHEFNG